MKRIRLALLPVLIGVLVFGMVSLSARAETSVYTHAEASALIDVTSGRILYSQNGEKPMRIASLTKIMTAIVAIEQGELSDKVKVGVNAYGVEGSSIYLRLGEEMSLQHLLYGLMLRSGNDAATAIAEHVGGSVEGFVAMMNEKAEQLGLAHTSFQNPHGLDAEGHLSSANDMAKLTAYSLRNPVFRDIVKTPSIKVPNSFEKWQHLWRNKNKMLHLYAGADGVKTGYTKTAKRTLVSSATRGGQQLAAVTLNDGDDWADHARLLDYGFHHYPLRELYRNGSTITGTKLTSPYSFMYPLTDTEFEQVSVDIVMEQESSVSARLGVKAAAVFRSGKVQIGKLPLYEAGHQVMNSPIADRTLTIRDNAMSMMKRLFAALFTV